MCLKDATPHFCNIVVELMVSGLPHVLTLWLGVNKGMLPVKYFRSTKHFVSVECHGDDETVTTLW